MKALAFCFIFACTNAPLGTPPPISDQPKGQGCIADIYIGAHPLTEVCNYRASVGTVHRAYLVLDLAPALEKSRRKEGNVG